MGIKAIDNGRVTVHIHTTAMQREAAYILRHYGAKLPASLRGPLRAVTDGTELPGTSTDILAAANAFL